MNKYKFIFSAFSVFCVSVNITHSQLNGYLYDDFRGTELSKRWGVYYGEPPHWQSSWEYLVDDSWLTVNKVWGPQTYNHLIISLAAIFVKIKGDFEASALVKWDDGLFQGIGFSVGSSGNPVTGIFMSYYVYFPETEPTILVHFGNWGGSAKFPAPPPGEHVFTIKRINNIAYAYVDSVLYYQSAVNYSGTTNGVAVSFTGPKEYDDPMFKPLSVDWVKLQALK